MRKDVVLTRQAPRWEKCNFNSKGAASAIARSGSRVWYGSAPDPGLRVSVLKTLSFTLLLVSLLALSAPAAAARLDHLFEARVAAAGRDNTSRDAALKQALDQVLVRVTGSRAAAGSPAAADLLENAGRYVEQYRYVENAGSAAADGGAAALDLWVQFDGVSLARDLRQAGLPYWGPERPDVLVWLAVDDRGRRYLVADGGDQPAGDYLARAAREQGLPVTLPLMDLQDQRAVDFTDVWGRFAAPLEAASQRYRPQAILSARLARNSSGDGWRADWQLLSGDSRQDWSGRADDLQAALDDGIASAAQWLAQRYAVVATTAGVRSLVVDDVRTLDDYARVSAYLASLSPVDRVGVGRVQQHSVEFDLALSADERNLQQLIGLGRILQRVDDPALWHYRLQP